MFSHHHRKVKLLLAVSDILLVILAFEAAYLSRQWLPFANNFYLETQTRALLLGYCIIVWPLMALWAGIYERLDAAHPLVILRDSFRQTAASAVAVVLFEFVLRLDLSRVFLGLIAFYALAFMILFRLNAGRLVRWVRIGLGGGHYVLVVGTNDRAVALARTLEESSAYGIRLMGFLEDTGETNIRLATDYSVRPLAALPGLLECEIVDEVIFCVDSNRLAGLEDLLLLCDEDGVRTRVAVDFFPHVHSEMYLDRLHAVPLLTFAAAPHDDVLLFFKRSMDVILAGITLFVCSPIFLIIAAAIKLTSPGPAIFQQIRCGLNGRRFTFYKFRSMVENAEALRPEVEHLNQKEIAFKIHADPRQTAIGRYLRKFSIDEWPQLWNVLKGDMSLVGPRPAVPGEVEQYQRWQRRRLRMRPGLTCLWALEGRDHLDFETWMRKDMEYIDNWSLSLDWKIIARTIPRVLSGRGAH